MRRPRIAIGVLAVLLSAVGGCAKGPYGPSLSTAYLKDGVYYCELHDRALRMDLVPIEYGYMPFNKAYRELRITTFPNSERYAGGGCSYDSDSPRHEWVWYCPDCRCAERCWEQQPESVKQATEHPPELSLKTLTDDADAGAECVLRQTNDDLIRIRMQHLRFSLTESKDWNAFRRTLAAYGRVAKKLEAGWPGFSGEIVSISGKKLRRRTEWDVLEQEYVMWSIFPSCFNPDVWSEVYTAFAPAFDHHDLRDAWLLGAISEPSYNHATLLRLAADSTASEPRTDAHGNRFQQMSGSSTRTPVRHILVTRPDGTQFCFTTFLIDEKVATTTEMIELCDKERARNAADPARFVIRPYWLH